MNNVGTRAVAVAVVCHVPHSRASIDGVSMRQHRALFGPGSAAEGGKLLFVFWCCGSEMGASGERNMRVHSAAAFAAR